MCPGCNSDLEIHVFPALLAPRAAIAPADLAISEGQASCYNHATKRAVASCQHCGRFLCALCQIEIDGGVWCPACLEAGVKQRKLAAVENHRTLYDSIALATAAIPAILIYPSIIGAPLALFISLRYWKHPSSLVPRHKWRLVAAIVLALFELLLLAALVIATIYAFRLKRAEPI
jgi:hypothetical protein